MRKSTVPALVMSLVIALALVLTGCSGGGSTTSRDNAPIKKVSNPKDYLTVKDVERVLEVDDVKTNAPQMNPTAQYQAVYEQKGQRLLIMNVLKASDWDVLQSIGTTEAIQGLGDKALRSSMYGVVFVKSGKLVAIGGFGMHEKDKLQVSDEKLLELALVVASRMR